MYETLHAVAQIMLTLLLCCMQRLLTIYLECIAILALLQCLHAHSRASLFTTCQILKQHTACRLCFFLAIIPALKCTANQCYSHKGHSPMGCTMNNCNNAEKCKIPISGSTCILLVQKIINQKYCKLYNCFCPFLQNIVQ